MLTYLLAIVMALGSFALYMVAFFLPELHRKYDLTWSGVGLFYALVLWVCAGRITGGLLLGQIASVALMGWFVWQAMELRWERIPLEQRTQVSGSANSLGDLVQEQSVRLWHYLQSEEWKSQLPASLEQGLDQAQNQWTLLKDRLNSRFNRSSPDLADLTQDPVAPPPVEPIDREVEGGR